MSKKCLREEMNILNFAEIGAVHCMKKYENDTEHETYITARKVYKSLNHRITDLLMLMPRNCINEGHLGGCWGNYCPCCEQNKERCTND